MESNLHRYRVYTLVDITKTDVITYSRNNEKARNQQRNWETVQQILSLRTQIQNLDHLGSHVVPMENYSFGINYQGLQRVWQVEFDVEHAELYTVDNDRYSVLKNDFSMTPIVTELDETVEFATKVFQPSGENKNIYFILKNI